MKKLIVTDPSGLISSEVCKHFHSLGCEIYGVDNNQMKMKSHFPARDISISLEETIKQIVEPWKNRQ